MTGFTRDKLVEVDRGAEPLVRAQKAAGELLDTMFSILAEHVDPDDQDTFLVNLLANSFNQILANASDRCGGIHSRLVEAALVEVAQMGDPKRPA
jgi:hypothetical protein